MAKWNELKEDSVLEISDFQGIVRTKYGAMAARKVRKNDPDTLVEVGKEIIKEVK